MNSASTSTAGRDTPAAREQAKRQPARTPNTDMQAEDTGSSDSEGGQADDSGSAATRAMKQTSKTAVESGNQR